jgi:formylmethanofuran dehydrogenase subunit E
VRTLEEDIAAALEYHGHLCAGMVMGVRMARAGVGYLGIEDPRRCRDLVVYVEATRCAADAVYAVTGITIGRRRLKVVDYGRLAMTFVDTGSGRAVHVRPQSSVPKVKYPEDPIAFFSAYSDEELFELQPVSVAIPADDMPGARAEAIYCEQCGERVVNGRAVAKDGREVCRPCAEGAAYYTVIEAAQ